MNENVFLRVEGLHAGYGPIEVLHDLDFTVEKSQIVVILGANGAGKTTTMRALSGMISRKGEVKFDGQQIGRWKPDAILRSGMSLVPQGRGTFTDVTVEENLRAGAYEIKLSIDGYQDKDTTLVLAPEPPIQDLVVRMQVGSSESSEPAGDVSASTPTTTSARITRRATA